jgi:dihydrolipoamide dehydrogenase
MAGCGFPNGGALVLMREVTCDTLVVGAGGGGYPAAFRLAAAGQEVVLADPRNNLGGHCLYEGCIPSKAVREAARLLADAQRGSRAGIVLRTDPAPSLWPGVRAFKDGVQTRRYAQHQQELAEARRLTLIPGDAELLDANTARITTADDEWRVHFRFALLATGSSAHTLPEIPDGWTSHDLFAWLVARDRLPQRLLIVGGGYIGVEVAMMLHPFDVQVTLAEMAPSILPQMDGEIQSALHDALTTTTEVLVNARVTNVSGPSGSRRVRLQTPAGLVERVVDEVLVATGRVPNVQHLGLERVGIAFSTHGVTVDEALRTTVPHIFAAGDVTGLAMLFHAAVRMSQVAAANILAFPDVADTFAAGEMPATVFATPEAHTVGLTLSAARDRDIPAEEIRRPMGVEARAQIAEETAGFLKMVVDTRNRTVLGVHAVGVDAAELAAVSHVIVREHLTVDQVARFAFPHPTQFEVFDRLAREAISARL